MPYKISGKVVGDDGYPIYQQAIIAEINSEGQQIANILSAEDTGGFVFFADNENSKIKITSPGYKEQFFLAKNIPTAIPLYPMDESVITVTRPKSNKTVLYFTVGTLAVAAIAAIVIGNKDKKKQTAKSKTVATVKPKPKALPKPKAKIVTV